MYTGKPNSRKGSPESIYTLLAEDTNNAPLSDIGSSSVATGLIRPEGGYRKRQRTKQELSRIFVLSITFLASSLDCLSSLEIMITGLASCTVLPTITNVI